MNYRWLINFVLGYLLEQIVKWRSDFDWDKFQAGAEAKVRDAIPGEIFDDVAVAVVRVAIKAARVVLDDKKNLSLVVAQITKGDWAGALVALRQMIEGIWKPGAIKEHNYPTTAERLVANDLGGGVPQDDQVGKRPEGAAEGKHEAFFAPVA